MTIAAFNPREEMRNVIMDGLLAIAEGRDIGSDMEALCLKYARLAVGRQKQSTPRLSNVKEMKPTVFARPANVRCH